MGNRALVIFTDGDRVSPVVYLHWCGDKVPAWLDDLKQLMHGREGDVDYSCARFIGLCHNRSPATSRWESGTCRCRLSGRCGPSPAPTGHASSWPRMVTGTLGSSS